MAAKAAARRDEMFARMCADARLTPPQLARLPVADLADLVRKACPGGRVDEHLLQGWAAEYARRANQPHSIPCR